MLRASRSSLHMNLDRLDIGKRLRAYRIGAGLTADDLAERLGISRAAVYRIEAGEIVKLEVLDRLADLLGTSLASLLGAGVEYHSRASSYFSRMQQLEAQADRIVAHFNPISYLLTSADYSGWMKQMLEESAPAAQSLRTRALADARTIWGILEARKTAARQRRPAIVNIVGVPEIERLLDTGLVGRLDLPPAVREERREAARREVEHLASLMQNEPLGVQIGLIEDVLPNVTFQLFYRADTTCVAVSPFRLGELPNIRAGVATVTSASEAISLYEELAQDLWSRALRGRAAAQRLLALARPAAASRRSLARNKRVREIV